MSERLDLFEGRDSEENQQAKALLTNNGLDFQLYEKDRCTTETGRATLITPAGDYSGLEDIESFIRIAPAVQRDFPHWQFFKE